MKYETVCGLEVHTELATKTKIFCSCTTAFGGAPNTHCCEVCTGMPGTLPVLNARVLAFAVRCGLALHCEITRFSRFDRKNYFYPDLPKAYQISQLYLPICRNGWVEIDDAVSGGKKRIRIREIHMEEDAGKLIHENGKTYVNYNRAGVPLLEIVSEPDFACGAEAAQYTQKLRSILRFCGISDCKMQEGSLRADVNVSVREQGCDTLGTRTEMKNLSSFKAIKAAVDTEAARQCSVLQNGGVVQQQTRHWDEKKNTSFVMRTKEEADDYKYFPEPDLPPLAISEAYIKEIADTLPELPEHKQARYLSMGLTEYDAALLCTEPVLVRLFEETAALTDSPKITANWILGDVMMLLGESHTPLEECTLSAEKLAAVIRPVLDGAVTRENGREVLSKVFYEDVNPAAYIKENNLTVLRDAALLEQTVQQVLRDNPKALAQYRQGKEKAFNFLLGQCMRTLKGKANAGELKRILTEKTGTE